jgi:hypothetical protein
MAFSTVSDLKYHTLKLNPIKMNLILAMPFENQDKAWFKQEDKNRLKQERKDADNVVLVDTMDHIQTGIF